jgi:hypothetical protein
MLPFEIVPCDHFGADAVYHLKYLRHSRQLSSNELFKVIHTVAGHRYELVFTLKLFRETYDSMI